MNSTSSTPIRTRMAGTTRTLTRTLALTLAAAGSIATAPAAHAASDPATGTNPYHGVIAQTPMGDVLCVNRNEDTQVSLNCDWEHADRGVQTGQADRVTAKRHGHWQGVRVKVGNAGGSMHCVTYATYGYTSQAGGMSCDPRSYGGSQGVRSVSMSAEGWHHTYLQIPGGRVPCIVQTNGRMHQLGCDFRRTQHGRSQGSAYTTQSGSGGLSSHRVTTVWGVLGCITRDSDGGFSEDGVGLSCDWAHIDPSTRAGEIRDVRDGTHNTGTGADDSWHVRRIQGFYGSAPVCVDWVGTSAAATYKKGSHSGYGGVSCLEG